MNFLRRHQLVWLARPPHPQITDHEGDVLTWHRLGRPFVVCRSREKSELSLGFCLPPVEPGIPPVRIAVSSHFDSVNRQEEPPSLKEAAGESAEILAALAAGNGLNIRIFGSRMWEIITGITYAREESDWDILVRVESPFCISKAVSFFRGALKRGVRIDGELSFPRVGEVHWLEFERGNKKVLLKSRDSVELVSASSLP